MAIATDWNVDFTAKLISHIDGVLTYDTGSGTQPAIGDVIRGGTSTTLGKILAITGTAASGTFTLTDVDGRFQDNEALTNCDRINFDGVVNSGFVVGDTITGATSTRSGVVRKIDYNMTTTAGFGTAWSEQFGAGAWTDNENIQVSGQTRALANGTGVDNSSTWSSALVNEVSGTIIPPTGSDCAIINFSSGTELIPRFATIQNTDDASPTKTALVQKVYGVTATGSLRVIDTVGSAWANADSLYVQKVPYDTLQTGQRFKVGDKIGTRTVADGTVNATGKIIAVEVLTSTTGKLTLQNKTGTLLNNDRIEVRTATDTWVALINAPAASDFQDLVATVSGAELVTQLASQGGIYNGGSLNIIRDSNALYTFLQDTFDEVSALDDEVPMSAQVALQQFTLTNSWKIPDLSYRFLESGSIQDSSLDNIWTNYQTLGSVEGIGNTAYAAITPLPQLYIEQNSSAISPWWYYGHIDVLLKVKTNTNPTTTANADGVLIDSGTVTVYCRNYTHTYDHFSTTTIAGVAPIPLATTADLNNQTGTHSLNYQTESGGPFIDSEEIYVSATPTKRGIITSLTDNGTTGTIEYILTGTVQFADTDTILGSYSACSAAVNGTPTSLVAGYGTKIVIATIEGTLTHGAVTGTFIEGEQVSQAVSGAQGIMMADTGSVMSLGNVTGTFDNTNIITGATSTATATSSSTLSTATTINRDIADGNGPQAYKAVVYLDRDQGDGVGDTLARMYEWLKYRTRSLETTGEPPYNLLGGPGTSLAGSQGRLYTAIDSSYSVIKASPFGTFAGGTFFGARGIFVQDMAIADVTSFQLIDAANVTRYPPITVTITVNGLVAGDRVSVFRATGSGENIHKTYLTSHATSNVTASTTFTVNETIPSDTPSSGYIRLVQTTRGVEQRIQFNSWSGSAFTLNSAHAGGYESGDSAYVPYIDTTASGSSVSVSVIYVADRYLLTRVRITGIVPYSISGQLINTGYSTTAIRDIDEIVT